MQPSVKAALSAAAGQENFSDDPCERHLHAYDASGSQHPPEAVIRAVDAAQISRVLAACSEYGVPLVARGSGTGLTGGAVPIRGGVVLNLGGLNRILRIDPADQTVVVQPGVITAKLQAEARRHGLFYPPDPASVDICSIGGNVAENAGGLRAVKYGVTRDYVLSLKAVLADGRIFETGKPTLKSVVGYDLTRLLVGSEGTLAVIVEITLRLLPLPEAKATVSALFYDLQEAAAGVRAALGAGYRPTALEFADAACLRAVENYAGLGIDPSARAMLLIDLDGPPEVVPRQAEDLAARLRAAGGRHISRAKTDAEAEKLWRARRMLNPALGNIARGKMNEDIVVPLGRLAEMMARIEEVARRHRLAIPTFGHAGDGNLHVNVMFDPDDPRQVSAAHQAVADVFAHTLALGGSLSGEHGVGITKRGYVADEIDPVAADIMRRIKRAFDPKGILNPDKALPAL